MRLLSQESEIEAVGEAADGQEAVETAGTLLPGVVLVDLSMPKLSGAVAYLPKGRPSSDLMMAICRAGSRPTQEFG